MLQSTCARLYLRAPLPNLGTNVTAVLTGCVPQKPLCLTPQPCRMVERSRQVDTAKITCLNCWEFFIQNLL